MVDDKPAKEGGVDAHLAAKRERSSTGSVVLGQDQDCLGGCFTPSNAFNGDMAVLRVWDRVRSQDDIKKNMMKLQPTMITIYRSKSKNSVRFMKMMVCSTNSIVHMVVVSLIVL